MTTTCHRLLLAGLVVCVCSSVSAAAGKDLTIDYPPASEPGALKLSVTYTLWVPDRVEPLRCVIVHQHGCGFDANSAGDTAAYDLHWQALADKWNSALLAPRYRQTATGREGCELWSDPRNGSLNTFLKALDDLAIQSGHPELRTAPWCLWGHSGGAFWASLMQTLAPERIVAVWLRSGTAYPSWEGGLIPKPTLTDAVDRIPTMLNPGIQESTDGRPIAAWLGSAAMFKAYRMRGAPIAFAADPLSGHDCGGSRYLAIPYFDACLKLRLPDNAASGEPLKSVDLRNGWLADLMGRRAVPAKEYAGKANRAVWLPDEHVARAWMAYVADGLIDDTTPPPAPTNMVVQRQSHGAALITWDTVADFESGLRAFVIERDGQTLAQVPETPVGKYGRPSFQTLSFHDTPEKPLPEMRYVDASAPAGSEPKYRVFAVNGVGLKSAPATVAAQ